MSGRQDEVQDEEDLRNSSDPDKNISKWATFKNEISLLLHFSMLAACTIGPGTVVTCSKSGADFGLDLIWALVLGSFVAYILQEGAARLSIVSGSGLGQAMRFHLGAEAGKIPILCAVVAIGVLVGNSSYEANNFVGANAALFSLGLPEVVGFRVFASFMVGITATCVLIFGEVDSTSRALGVVVVAMVCLFGASLFQIGFTAKAFGEGLLPNFPAGGGGVTALSMVSTTALPFNCFLASAAAEGFTLEEMRRGIACSTALAGLLSFFVVVTGSGIDSKDDFSVGDVTDELRKTEGEAAGVLFGIGLFAAAFSSALSCALGASITCQSLLAHSSTRVAKSPGREEGMATSDTCVEETHNPVNESSIFQSAAESSHGDMSSEPKHSSSASTLTTPQHSDDVRAASSENTAKPNKTHSEFGRWADDGLYFRFIIVAIALVGISVGSSGANTINVIITAQVVNGLLLPLIAVCLLVCLNDEHLMRKRPISLMDNSLLVLVVAATFFLSAHTIVGTMVENEADVLIGSAVLMFIFMVPILSYIVWLVKKKGLTYADLESQS